MDYTGGDEGKRQDHCAALNLPLSPLTNYYNPAHPGTQPNVVPDPTKRVIMIGWGMTVGRETRDSPA